MVERYRMEADCTVEPMNASMYESADGDYVEYSDYAALEAERDELKKQLADCGGPRICLLCGKQKPCGLEYEGASVCDFDPTYPEAVQMWKDMKARCDELQRRLDAVVERLAPETTARSLGYHPAYELYEAVMAIAEGRTE